MPIMHSPNYNLIPNKQFIHHRRPTGRRNVRPANRARPTEGEPSRHVIRPGRARDGADRLDEDPRLGDIRHRPARWQPRATAHDPGERPREV